MHRIFYGALIISMGVSMAGVGRNAQAEDPEQVTSVEGITEYRLENGLRVLLFPDNSKPTVTVNLTVFVGSRHEGYGEAGMAHLLEHMLFKGTPTHPQVPKVLQDRGARFNGTTWVDRTNYYETLPASDENLEFAIRLESDRMMNSFVRGEDLVSEMTVVRNEFERGENSPSSVLSQRMMSAAFLWHNYGQATIGNRADIERVPVENLRAFYRKYYQPDNAMLVVAGRFEEAKALEFAQKYFGPIPVPERELPRTYTEEPPQDGERVVSLRRVGEVAVVGALYHIPAGGHADYVPIDILESVLTSAPGGRLYEALVKTQKAASVSGAAFALHDPAVLRLLVEAAPGNEPEPVLEAMLDVIDQVRTDGVTEEEVERARAKLQKQRELAADDSADIAIELSEWAAMGDWRLFFIYRDRLESATVDDVNRVARTYLVKTNRTVGLFHPTEKPERVSIPDRPDLAEMIGDYKGREIAAQGEIFDVSPANIDERTDYRPLASGVKAAILPKKTRGESVSLRLKLRYGSPEALSEFAKAADFLPLMMTRGTAQLSRQELQDRLDRSLAKVSISGGPGEVSVTVQTKRKFLSEVLDLVRQMLREPSFPVEELDVIKQQQVAALEQGLNDPQALAIRAVSRKLNPYPPGDVRYMPTIEEEIELVKAVTVDDLKKLYGMLSGETGELAAVGDFDAAGTRDQLEGILDQWTTQVPFERITRTGDVDVAGAHEQILTPDKANALYFGGQAFPMNDEDSDYAPLVIGNFIFGAGSLSSRLGDRVRQKEGLSYGVGSNLRSSALDDRSTLSIYAIFNPENEPRVVEVIREEFTKLMAEGVTEDELNRAKQGYLQRQEVSRTEDSNLSALLLEQLSAGRSMEYQARLERQISELTPEDVLDAMKRRLSVDGLFIVTAGDFAAEKPAAP